VRLEFIHASPEQRSALRARLESLQQPHIVEQLLQSCLPTPGPLLQTACTPCTVSADRFVLHAEIVTAGGQREAYALKGYADDRGRQVMAVYEALAARWNHHATGCAVSIPVAYVPQERVLISRWVPGISLAAAIERGQVDLLARAATTLGRLHSAGVVPEAASDARAIVDVTLARCERAAKRWPWVAETMTRLQVALQEALPRLAPASPALVHGDADVTQFLWDGRGMMLLDLDMFGYTDPAYEAGHLLAQLRRRSLSVPTLPAAQLLAIFRTAYFAAMPGVSAYNVSFYYGLTLVRKIYTVCRKQPPDWPRIVEALDHHARTALEKGEL
jgi:hypothetical protein